MVEKAGRTEAPLGSHRKPGRAEHGGPQRQSPSSRLGLRSAPQVTGCSGRRPLGATSSSFRLTSPRPRRLKPAGDRSSVLQGQAGCSPGSAAAVSPARCSARSAGPAGGGAQGAGGGGGGGGGGVRGGSAPFGLPPAGARGCSRAATRTKKKKAERRGRFPTGAGGPAVGGQPSVPGSSQSAARGPCRRWRRKPARGRGGPAVLSPSGSHPQRRGPASSRLRRVRGGGGG